MLFDRFRRLSPYLILALVSFLAGGLVYSVAYQEPAARAEQGAPEATSDAPAATAVLPGVEESPALTGAYLIADVAERVSPAVVYIEAQYPAPERTQVRDPFLEWWFGFNPYPPGSQQPATARGTGFIISEDGYILTNQHVVGSPGDGQKITVKLTTAEVTKTVDAELVGSDYSLDLAVLKIEKPQGLDRLPVLPLGNSDNTRPGEWVVAIGNPYGERFEHTVTVGVISAKGRQIQVWDQENNRSRPYKDLMQTDAAINPGNSGGPLVNVRGEAIGINTAVSTEGQNIGFAIPINAAKQVVDQLIKTGKVIRPYVGISMHPEPLTRQLARQLGLPDTSGVLVLDVAPGTPAEKAGLQLYDVIRKINKTDIKDADQFTAELSKYKPGDQVILVVWRQGRLISLVVELTERPAGL